MITVKVASKSREALDICTFELVDPAGRALPAFTPGSHIDVHIREGLVRQYSLCNDSRESHRYVIGVLRDPKTRGGSKAMHDDIRVGDLLRISAPRNHFALAPDAGRSLLLAGGIGITPLLCMAEHLSAIGADFQLHYCTRSEARTAFRERIHASGFSDRVVFHVDDGPPHQRADFPALLGGAEAGTHLYVCGPAGFLESVIGTARSKDWIPDNIHYEYFAAARPQGGGGFDVKLARSGRIIAVPADRTIVEALAANGVEIPVSCEQGICGTCLTRVLDGEVEHRDSYLTPEEQARNDQLTPCCSRAKSQMLVLDL